MIILSDSFVNINYNNHQLCLSFQKLDHKVPYHHMRSSEGEAIIESITEVIYAIFNTPSHSDDHVFGLLKVHVKTHCCMIISVSADT